MPIRLPDVDTCYFCAIREGAVDGWNVVERTGLTMTLLNGRQYEIGQCMVIPQRHAPTLFDLTPDEDSAIMAAARRLAQAMVAAFDPDGVLLYQNNGVGSGQEVPHFHLHVVARQQGSNWGLDPPHLARLHGVPEYADHTVVTDPKRRTADVLRNHLRASGAAIT